ncbi:hypothetical protein [Photobacterium indicum]|uniref:Uncharacterized protein n=1 Tax=Photobacterium indicum TaxID=81447 RepID=A0A2T3L3D4_9GAMM|nr:hypothetical protein [Photobacterium indicum]PSV43609.1 hypothetical protein C9J47_22335 [Photobacterium indicum]
MNDKQELNEAFKVYTGKELEELAAEPPEDIVPGLPSLDGCYPWVIIDDEESVGVIEVKIDGRQRIDGYLWSEIISTQTGLADHVAHYVEKNWIKTQHVEAFAAIWSDRFGYNPGFSQLTKHYPFNVTMGILLGGDYGNV